MPEQFLLEREYLRAEFDRSRPLQFVVIGLLLGYAFGRQTANRHIEQLVGRLSGMTER